MEFGTGKGSSALSLTLWGSFCRGDVNLLVFLLRGTFDEEGVECTGIYFSFVL